MPEDIFTKEVNISQVCDMSQRLASPEFQPIDHMELYPLHKHILVKKSLRCRHCEHNLSKPEYNPSSVKFKIQLGAFYHVPEVRMVTEPLLKAGEEGTVQISLCNPTPHNITLALLPYVAQTHTKETSEEAAPLSGVGPPSLVRAVEVPSEGSPPEPNAAVVLPIGTVVLAARDDTAEYDDVDSIAQYNDDPTVVAWRRANKVGVNLQVTVPVGIERGTVAFVLRYDYTNTVATATDQRSVTLSIPVLLDLGLVKQPNESQC